MKKVLAYIIAALVLGICAANAGQTKNIGTFTIIGERNKSNGEADIVAVSATSPGGDALGIACLGHKTQVFVVARYAPKEKLLSAKEVTLKLKTESSETFERPGKVEDVGIGSKPAVVVEDADEIIEAIGKGSHLVARVLIDGNGYDALISMRGSKRVADIALNACSLK